MKNKLATKIFMYLAIFSLFILIFLFFFQVIFIDTFYEWTKTKTIKNLSKDILVTENDTSFRHSGRKTRITSYNTTHSRKYELFEELMHQAGDGIPLQVRYRHTQKSLKSRQCPFGKRQLIERRIDDLM